MKRSEMGSLLTVASGTVAVLLGFLTGSRVDAQPPGPPGGLAVRVVNIPLPVTGTVSITEAGQPFQTTLCSAVFHDTTCSDMSLAADFTVPAGFQLVIEFESGRCGVSSEAGPANIEGVFLTTTSGNVAVNHFPVPFFVPKVSAPGESLEFSWAQQTRIYADPGTSVRFAFTNNAEAGACTIGISGLLVHKTN